MMDIHRVGLPPFPLRLVIYDLLHERGHSQSLGQLHLASFADTKVGGLETKHKGFQK